MDNFWKLFPSIASLLVGGVASLQTLSAQKKADQIALESERNKQDLFILKGGLKTNSNAPSRSTLDWWRAGR